MAEIPAGRIGHSSEIFVYTDDDDYVESVTRFGDLARTVSGNNTPLFYPPGQGEANRFGGWRGYSNRPENFTKIGRIRDISGPEPSVNEVEVTSNDSPLNYKEFIPGLKDGGNVSFDMIYDVRDATQTGSGSTSMEKFFEDQETRRFAIRVPVYREQDRITDIAGNEVLLDRTADPYGGSSGYAEAANSITKFSNQAFILFAGFVMRLGNEIPMEDAIMRNVEFKVTGRVKSPNLAVPYPATLQANRYIAVKSTNTFAAGDFTGDPFTTNLLRIPAFTTSTSHIGFALPATESDPTNIKLGGLGTSRLGRFREQGNITLNGTTYTVWQTRSAQAQTLSGRFLEIIQ